MKIKHTYQLLSMLLGPVRYKRHNTGTLVKILTRIKSSLSMVLQFFYFQTQGKKVTVVAGNAVRFGSGRFELIEPTFLKLIEVLWTNKFDIDFISPDKNGHSFHYLLKNEINQEDKSTTRFILTPQNILMIEYSQKRQRLMSKLASTDSGKAYIKRQVSALTDNKYLTALNTLHIDYPKLIEDSWDANGRILLQSYVNGYTLSIPTDDDSKLLHSFALCSATSLKINKMIHCSADNWKAYSDFNLLPMHYAEYKTTLQFIINSANDWLLNDLSTPVYIHGDYHFGNIIFDEKYQKIVGMIDFDRSTTGGTELHDTLMLFLNSFSTKTDGSRMFYGEVVIRLLEDSDDRHTFKEALENICSISGYDIVDVKRMAVILWLFILQSAMREEQAISELWRTKMLVETLPVAYRFCQDVTDQTL